MGLTKEFCIVYMVFFPELSCSKLLAIILSGHWPYIRVLYHSTKLGVFPHLRYTYWLTNCIAWFFCLLGTFSITKPFRVSPEKMGEARARNPFCIVAIDHTKISTWPPPFHLSVYTISGCRESFMAPCRIIILRYVYYHQIQAEYMPK